MPYRILIVTSVVNSLRKVDKGVAYFEQGDISILSQLHVFPFCI
mgnify:CR=1 FL=1